MADKKSLQEVAQMEEPSQQPTIADDPDDGDEGGLSMPSLPLPSVSRRQGLALAGVAVVVVLLYLYQRDSGNSAVDVSLDGGDGGESSRETEPKQSEAEIQLPNNPDEITEYDAAILDSDVFDVVGNEEDG